MVTCSKCGAEHQPNAFYCSNCGVPIIEEGVGGNIVKVPGLSICIVLMITGIVLFFAGIILELLGSYDYQKLTDYAGLIMIAFGLIVIISSFFLYRSLS
jgi:small neutral amino acid transporter SnatA (MarC family)